MTPKRKRRMLFGLCVLLLAAGFVSGFLLFDSGQKQGSGNDPVAAVSLSQEDIAKKELAKAAIKLVADITSGNQAAYKDAWAYANIPPLPPPGTSIVIGEENTTQVHETYGRIGAMVKMPGKSVNSVIHLKRIDGSQWRIYLIEEVK